MWQLYLEKEAELKLSRGHFNFDRSLKMFLACKLVTGVARFAAPGLWEVWPSLSGYHMF